MTSSSSSSNSVRLRRLSIGLTQDELAERAGISRTAVTAIEGARLVPSVRAAMALAKVLETTVEELFTEPVETTPPVWAWSPAQQSDRFWSADVQGRTIHYPADSTPQMTPLPESEALQEHRLPSHAATETLVMASCDPAAGYLASCFAGMTGMRLLVLQRSSRQSLELLQQGLVHLAGLHLSTPEEPDANEALMREHLPQGFRYVRLARWQEGVVVSSGSRVRSLRGTLQKGLQWVGREAGSGARHCQDRLRQNRPVPRYTARNHRGVAEAVLSGWAEAGICLQLVGAEAGLQFLPVQEEAFDVCYPPSLENDRRLQAFLSVVRSKTYHSLLEGLPGYNVRETGLTGGS